MILRLLLVMGLLTAACTAQGVETTLTEAPTTLPGEQVRSIGTAQTGVGTVLVDHQGRTLYIFNQDQDGVSACYDECETNWPIVAADLEAGGLDITIGATTRTDGVSQLTINGRPAYLFAGDSGPGDINGQGFGSVWFVLGSDGEPITFIDTGGYG